MKFGSSLDRVAVLVYCMYCVDVFIETGCSIKRCRSMKHRHRSQRTGHDNNRVILDNRRILFSVENHRSSLDDNNT